MRKWMLTMALLPVLLSAAEVRIYLGENLSDYALSRESRPISYLPRIGGIYHGYATEGFQGMIQPTGETRGFSLGAGCVFLRAGNFSLEADLGYSRRGTFRLYETGQGGQAADLQAAIRVHALELPLLVKYRLNPGTSPYILAGVSAMFQFLDTLPDAGGGEAGIFGRSLFDLGFVFGLGIEVKLKKLSFFSEGRYQGGGSDLTRDFAAAVPLKPNTFIFLAGVGMDLRRARPSPAAEKQSP